MTKIYQGPFISPRIRADQSYAGKSVINFRGRPLAERIEFLERHSYKLENCIAMPELQRQIYKQIRKLLPSVGRLLCLAFFGQQNDFISFTPETNQVGFRLGIAYESTPPRIFTSKNLVPTFPLQPDLIRAAIDTKNIHLEESGNAEHLVFPLVDPGRTSAPEKGKVLGVFLLVNLFRNDQEKTTEDDIALARTFAEKSAEEICRLMPTQYPGQFS